MPCADKYIFLKVSTVGKHCFVKPRYQKLERKYSGGVKRGRERGNRERKREREQLVKL